jgi:hypothetical protein
LVIEELKRLITLALGEVLILLAEDGAGLLDVIVNRAHRETQLGRDRLVGGALAAAFPN